MGLFSKATKVQEPPPFTPVAQIGTKGNNQNPAIPQPPTHIPSKDEIPCDVSSEEYEYIKQLRAKKEQEKQALEQQVTGLTVCPSCGAVYGKLSE